MSILESYLFLKVLSEIWDEAHYSIDILDQTDQWTFSAAEEKTTIKLSLRLSYENILWICQECGFMTILLLYTVSYFSENRPLPGSDSHPLFKYASTRSVFELLLPIHMKTLKRWKYNSIPYRVCVMQQSRTEKNRTANPHPPKKSRMKPRKSQNAPFYHFWF